VEQNRKGTLTLVCPDDSYVVEIWTERPPTRWERISGADVRPEWTDWGRHLPESASERCVWLRELEHRIVDMKLLPGRYSLGAHRKSECGHYGGDIFEVFEIEEGGQVVITISH
jgi:hypothetical protein